MSAETWLGVAEGVDPGVKPPDAPAVDPYAVYCDLSDAANLPGDVEIAKRVLADSGYFPSDGYRLWDTQTHAQSRSYQLDVLGREPVDGFDGQWDSITVQLLFDWAAPKSVGSFSAMSAAPLPGPGFSNPPPPAVTGE